MTEPRLIKLERPTRDGFGGMRSPWANARLGMTLADLREVGVRVDSVRTALSRGHIAFDQPVTGRGVMRRAMLGLPARKSAAPRDPSVPTLVRLTGKNTGGWPTGTVGKTLNELLAMGLSMNRMRLAVARGAAEFVPALPEPKPVAPPPPKPRKLEPPPPGCLRCVTCTTVFRPLAGEKTCPECRARHCAPPPLGL